MADHNDLGKLGEEKAVAYLQELGYFIKERNFRYLKGEIDIIAEFQNEIIIIEVKTRSDDGMLDPEDAVNTKKKKMLIETASF